MMSESIANAIIVSDLHIGLPCFQRRAFVDFVSSMDPEAVLILNGDTIDDPYQKLKPDDQAVLDFLRQESLKRRVIWLRGNHDENFVMPDAKKIEFRDHLAIDKRLMIIHGDDFEAIMANNLLFIRLFKLCHVIRIKCGARPVHVAQFAKAYFPFLYRILTEEVKKNAVNSAIENGFAAITCGHTHYAEDSYCEGVRYINTGTWTEEPLHYIHVQEKEICLKAK